MGHYHDLSKRIGASTRDLRKQIPGVYQSFADLHRSALIDGALSGGIKELIALAISVVDECDGCIASHARGAARLGATDQEVAEAIGVAILMSGGPERSTALERGMHIKSSPSDRHRRRRERGAPVGCAS